MELKEAIEILKNLQDWYKEGNMSTTIESSELESICIVLQALDNSISKDKIKEKIELIKTLRVAFYNEANVISILQELLKGG